MRLQQPSVHKKLVKGAESYLKLMQKLARFEFLVEEVGGAWRFEEEEVRKKKNKGKEAI